jgi:putative cell wall-binding protein
MRHRLGVALLAAATAIASVFVAVPATAGDVLASQLPGLLRQAPETTAPPYDRDRFEHWIDADSDGCNTRFEVLLEESTTEVEIEAGCALSGGTWVSPYDGFVATAPAEIEIDHVVALAEAWRSGASAWSDEQRRAFSNDLDVPYALSVSSTVANQSKADKDPARWLPSNTAYTCEYVTSWALLKYRWSLAVDPAELAAIESELSGDCGAATVTLPAVMITVAPEVPSQPGQPVIAPFPDGVTRLAGASRYRTAVAASAQYGPGVPAVFIATGTTFPDALSAAAAAALLGGPLLLTHPTSTAPAVLDEVRRLAPEQIYVVGGPVAVDDSVLNTFAGIAPTTRLGGASRYATGLGIVTTLFESSTHAIIATGRSFPDALAATGAAGSRRAPVILVDGQRPTVTQQTLDALHTLGVTSVGIAGGPNAVSAGIAAQLSSYFTVTRYGGVNRYETAALINNAYFSPDSTDTSFLATGTAFPDALAAGALAGRLGAPLYITTPACVPSHVRSSLSQLGATKRVVMGGTVALSENAAANLGCLTAGTPTISGAARVGSTLTARPGAWTAGTQLSYQWLANGAPIANATQATLAVTNARVGARISVQLTGTLAGYVSVSKRSEATASVPSPAPPPPPPPGPPGPVVSGSVTAGAFCARAVAGWYGYTSGGTLMQCKISSTDSRLRWRAA